MTESFIGRAGEGEPKHLSDQISILPKLNSEANFWLDTALGVLPAASEAVREDFQNGQAWGALGQGAGVGVALSWMINASRPMPVRLIGTAINAGMALKFAWDSGQMIGKLWQFKDEALNTGNYHKNVEAAKNTVGGYVAEGTIGILGGHAGFLGERGIHFATNKWSSAPRLSVCVPIEGKLNATTGHGINSHGVRGDDALISTTLQMSKWNNDGFGKNTGHGSDKHSSDSQKHGSSSEPIKNPIIELRFDKDLYLTNFDDGLLGIGGYSDGSRLIIETNGQRLRVWGDRREITENPGVGDKRIPNSRERDLCERHLWISQRSDGSLKIGGYKDGSKLMIYPNGKQVRIVNDEKIVEVPGPKGAYKPSESQSVPDKKVSRDIIWDSAYQASRQADHLVKVGKFGEAQELYQQSMLNFANIKAYTCAATTAEQSAGISLRRHNPSAAEQLFKQAVAYERMNVQEYNCGKLEVIDRISELAKFYRQRNEFNKLLPLLHEQLEYYGPLENGSRRNIEGIKTLERIHQVYRMMNRSDKCNEIAKRLDSLWGSANWRDTAKEWGINWGDSTFIKTPADQ